MISIRKRIDILVCLSFLTAGGCSSPKPLVEKLDTAAQQTSAAPIQFSSFWEAMENLDFSYSGRQSLDEDKQTFADALKLIETGELDSAETKFRALQVHSADPLARKHAARLLQSVLFHQSKWSEALNLAADPVYGTIHDLALIEAYNSAPGEKYSFPVDQVELPVTLSRTGSPIVPVVVNGKRKNLWLDTGASVTALSSDVAEECNVRPVGDREERTQTATTKEIGSRPAVISELAIGGIRIQNHPAVILRKEDLEFRVLRFIRILKVDGIIGWNAIKNIDIEIDYGKKHAVFRRPVQDVKVERNFFWIDYPVVTCKLENGRTLRMGLDTGASRSSIRENILKKIPAPAVRSEKLKTGSAGGWDTSDAKVLPFLEIYVSGYRLQFKEIATHASDLAAFIKLDGVLGSDIAQNARIRLDFLNGRFTLAKPE